MRKIILLLILIFTAGITYSQTLMHGVGAGLMWSRHPVESISGGIVYSLKIIFLQTNRSSVSVGLPIYLAATPISYRDNESEFVTHIPVMANYNFGRGSSLTNHTKMGFFVGGGFAYHHGTIENTTKVSSNYKNNIETIDAFGPAANAGIRIGTGRHTKKNIEVSFFYFKAINAHKPQMFGIGTQYNF